MAQKINERVSLLFATAFSDKARPIEFVWRSKVYKIDKLALYHNFWRGKVLYHVFSVQSQNFYFRLSLNSQNLLCTLEEAADVLPD